MLGLTKSSSSAYCGTAAMFVTSECAGPIAGTPLPVGLSDPRYICAENAAGPGCSARSGLLYNPLQTAARSATSTKAAQKISAQGS